MFSILDMIIAAENENVIYKKKMQVAFLVMKSSRRLPNTSVDFLLRNVVMTERTKTAKVVVLIPPAVEPGEPPISIRLIIRNRPV